MRRGPGIRRLLMGATFLALLLPISTCAGLQVYSTHLLRLTEQALISESVVVAEAFRDRWLEAQGRDLPRVSEALLSEEPIEPAINMWKGLGPDFPLPTKKVGRGPGPEWLAGERVQPILMRAKEEILTVGRVLDAKGCVVASCCDDVGLCFDELPEVKAALAGRYASVVRGRLPSDGTTEAAQRLATGLRVFTALPIRNDGKVIGIVRMSRGSKTPAREMWLDRRMLVLAGAATLGLMVLVSLISARTITRPVREITAAAQAIARGEPRKPLAPGGVVPAEVFDLSEALDTMTAQLSDRAAYISEFAANVSHELKTPLAGITGAAELLADGWEEMNAAERSRFLEIIRADVGRMERLVSRLLQLARIQSAPAEAETVPLRPLLDRLALQYGSQVRVDLSAAPETITIHPEHLESAIRNLLDNAVRHGAGQPVDVAVSTDSGRTVIRVRDRGPGISKGNRERVFQRFFTTERDRGGTGLGLSIVQAVAATRGGSVRYETAAEGTTFILTL
jgi:signal transduction histidine kinase